MASTAREDTGESSSVARDGSLSQPPPAGPPEAADDSRCPICLGPMKRPAYVTYCMHRFCLRCIRQWARARDNCPVCRQPMEQLLHSVRGDGNYKECAVGLSARLRRRAAMERAVPPVTAVMLQYRRSATNSAWPAEAGPWRLRVPRGRKRLQGPPPTPVPSRLPQPHAR